MVELVRLVPNLAHPESLIAVEMLGQGGHRFRPLEESSLTTQDIRPSSEKECSKAADPFEELDSLVGLADAKRQIHEIAQLLAKRGKDSLPCLHMVFRGNPGTGKTTVARIIGDIFSEIGVISNKGKFIETDRVGLVGQYIGHTAVKTASCIESAQGGVLFIDEAYALGMYSSDLGAGPEGVIGRRDFGPEALSTLVKAMEDKRDGFICIMAGYTDLM
ncbi:MAG: AAA family ATPase, partial [Actinobacteria bacterium]|nr:AAA family ATPase [Actinomycetota bacterium]